MKKVIVFFNREQNLLIHIISSILVIIFGFIFKISLIEWALVILMIVMVITTELINSAIELSVDIYTKEFKPLAMVAKDVSAAAVVTAAFCALCVGIYIFIPKIILIIK